VQAWRIGSAAHPVFDGAGAALVPGRWNEAGQPVIYAGASFAIAMLERLCYTALGRLPRGDRCLAILVPDDLVEEFDPAAHQGWDAPESPIAREFGARWWRERRSAALLVPSAVTGIDRNLVINARHGDFERIEAGPERLVRWDHRLFWR
jgi:RES domain-containing protein